MAKRVMTGLKLARIAAVDRPCQEGALAAITKRAATLPPEAESYLKRDFTKEEDSIAKVGAALPDGSFPVENRSDVKNAVCAVSLAKNIVKAKAHIVTRARALDATSLLPDAWKSSKRILLQAVSKDDAMEGFSAAVEAYLGDMGAADFDDVQAECEAREYACGLLDEIDEAVCSLRTVFYEINDDGSVTDKQKALQESLEQFKAHIQGIIPEGLENAMVAAALTEAGFSVTEGGALTKRETDDMGYSIELKKSLGLPVTATEADVEKAIQIAKGGAAFALNVLKMSAPHLAYMGTMFTDEVAKQDFAAKSEADRDVAIKAKPMPKSKDQMDAEEAAEKAAKAKADEEEAKKRAAGDEVLKVGSVEIRKSVIGEAQFAVLKSQQAEIAKLQDNGAVAEITKRVTTSLPHIGKADELGALLHGIAKLGTEGVKLAEAVEKKFDQLEALIAKGGKVIFEEVGKAGNGQAADGATAIEKIAQAMVAKGEAKNIFKARVMARDANPELAKQETAERAAKKAA